MKTVFRVVISAQPAIEVLAENEQDAERKANELAYSLTKPSMRAAYPRIVDWYAINGPSVVTKESS